MIIDEVTPRDNALHEPTHPNYIEWWYVDALFDKSFQLAGSFGVWGDLQRPSSCVIRSDFLLATPEGTIVDFCERVPLSSFDASADRCDVYLGRNYFRDTGEHYLLHLQREDGVSLDLVITPECSGFGYTHHFNNDENKHFSWIVPVPHARVQGSLKYAEAQISLEGVGYHDHNWASVSLSRELRGWRWGRFHGDDTVLVFAAVEGKHQTLFQGVALIEPENEPFGYRYLRFGFPTPDVIMEESPLGWNLAIIDENIKLQMSLENTRPMPQRERVTDYHRFLSRASGKLRTVNNERSVSGLMVHELKQLG